MNDAGRQQARLPAEYFKRQRVVFGRVYSSLLIRAVDTVVRILEDAGKSTGIQF